MLVVGRVEVGDVGLDGGRRLEGVEAERRAGAVEHARQAQLELAEGARRPLLEVGHLHAGRRVDAVGGLHEGDEQHRLDVGVEAAGRPSPAPPQPPPAHSAMRSRIASTRAPLRGWKKRARSQNVSVK